MSDIYITGGEYEKCLPGKEPIKALYPMCAIHYITDGKGFFNGRILTAGQGFICLKNQSVQYYPDRENPWTYLWVRFEGTGIDAILKDCGLSTPPFYFNFDWTDSLKKTAGLFLVGNRYVSRGMLFDEGCAKLLLSYHNRANLEHLQKSQRQLHVDAVKEYIHANYYRRIEIGEIANSLHLNRGYLRNIFFKYENSSPQEYLINVRMRRAKELLESDSIPVSIIASSVGYQDVAQFYRIFKKYVGVSPSTYRFRTNINQGSSSPV